MRVPDFAQADCADGLVGKRNRKLENRPSVIIIPPKPGDVGPARQIVPDQATAIARDAILRKGQDVHAKLERELAPVPAQAIYVEGPVDRMGVQCVCVGVARLIAQPTRSLRGAECAPHRRHRGTSSS